MRVVDLVVVRMMPLLGVPLELRVLAVNGCCLGIALVGKGNDGDGATKAATAQGTPPGRVPHTTTTNSTATMIRLCALTNHANDRLDFLPLIFLALLVCLYDCYHTKEDTG